MSTNMLRTALLLAALLLGLVQQANAQREPVRSEMRGVIKSVDAGAITIAMGGGRDVAPTEKSYALAKDVEIAFGSAFRFVSAVREGKLKDLSAGITVSLSLSADQKNVESILAEEPTARGMLKAVDAKKRTLTITSPPTQREQPGEDKTYTVAADAEIAIDDGRGRRFSIREGRLEELTDGAIVSLRLSLDKTQVFGVVAEGAMVMGVIKAIDAGKRSLTLTIRPARGDDAGEERTLIVAKEASVFVDDGKGRRLSIKEVKLADVPVGSTVMAKLAVDQSFIMMLKAEGPQVLGLLKAVDAEKRTITIAIPKSREEVDEKTYTLSKDARINYDGNEAKLADIKIGENGPFVQLRLTLDQKTVQSLTARQPGTR